MNSPKRIIIIGAGASGTLLAVNLLRKTTVALDLFLVEKTGSFGPGIAYSTPSPLHLLNVPAGRMSAFPHDPLHFLNWLEQRMTDITETSFVSRQLFGTYLKELLENEEKSLKPNVRFQRITDEAVSATIDQNGQGVVGFKNGTSLTADAVILAVGNLPPGHTTPFFRSFEKSPRYVSNIWTSKVLQEIGREETILILGTGLTMVDAAVGFRARGHKGKIFALSRRGLLSMTHRHFPTYPPFLSNATAPRTVLGLLKRLRQEIRKAQSEGSDWRPVVDSLRGLTQTLWRGFSLVEKRRFLRHLRPYWDIHRHRMAPAISDSIYEMVKSGQLILLQGRMSRMTERPDGFQIEYTTKGKLESLPAVITRVINCTGPECDYRKIEYPLVNDLVQQHLAWPDASGMGLEVNMEGRILEVAGRASKVFYGIGPIRKGHLWETTAVPELRVQASDISDLLLL